MAELGVVRRFLPSPVKPAITLLFLFTTVALGTSVSPPMEPGDGGGPLFFMALAFIGISIMLFLVGVGIVATGIAALSATILVALGIVSSAALVGILRRRFSSGFRAFHYQVCAIAAIPAGVGALWLGAHLFTTHLRHRDILAIGSVAGILSGLVLAFAFDRLASIAYRRFVTPPIPNATVNA